MQVGMNLLPQQTLKLTLTPEIRQSITILQFSSQELIDFLHKQSIESPLLEVKERYDHFVARSFKSNSSFQYVSENNHYNPINHYSDTKTTLENHLTEQVALLKNITPLQNKLVKFLIGSLNEHGFLEIEPAKAARIFSVVPEEVEKAVSILQSLDPVGVGARNLTDCLLIQMRNKSEKHVLAYQIVENQLEDLAEKWYVKLAKKWNVTVQEVQEAADFVKTLNPRPCSKFYYEMTQYVIPDVIVENVQNDYLIFVNDSMIPDLTINPLYKSLLKKNNKTNAEDYIKKKYSEAMILMNGIAQRKQTLYKVTKAITEKQKEFLQSGMSGLKPMTLKEIADEIGYHESTVSRATSNKYIQTQHGLFKLKSLFSTGLTRADQVKIDSSMAIKEKIKAFVKNEKKEKPFSDQALVQLLEEDGILISRRTVTKYREEIGIPSSTKRKRF